jgi:hypothetical protein
MSTVSASDRVVHRSDRAGFRMFPREFTVRKGWNAVRVPPRARVSLFRGFFAADGVQSLTCGPLRGPIFLGGGWSGGSFSWLGQRCCCLLLHGRGRLELHDLLRLGDQILMFIPVGSRNPRETVVMSSMMFSSIG